MGGNAEGHQHLRTCPVQRQGPLGGACTEADQLLGSALGRCCRAGHGPGPTASKRFPSRNTPSSLAPRSVCMSKTLLRYLYWCPVQSNEAAVVARAM